ncbi:hypothetical protein E2562_035499 [Oryza meyeriana var. granulata]|uniref:Transcription repressor n=1 Tax=Oryza meyeriana var. granulata TaxID=110450 RepID=A0A6G1ESP1_9ORYZ|nr:hypothetical protein E2562_035499 [Oryza meyeriana var. granulata]
MASDSSGFYAYSKQQQQQQLLPHKSKNRHHRRHRQQKTRRRHRRASSCVEEACSVKEGAVGSFRPLVTATAAAEEEVRKGLAVVKRSRDPYGDFRESMAEMIVERQVFGAAELERLLRSYLSLNPPRLHPVILQAFSDIWVVLRGC